MLCRTTNMIQIWQSTILGKIVTKQDVGIFEKIFLSLVANFRNKKGTDLSYTASSNTTKIASCLRFRQHPVHKAGRGNSNQTAQQQSLLFGTMAILVFREEINKKFI